MAKASLAKGSRITGAERDKLATQYKKDYTAGKSIRSIADDTGRSYGFVHGVLAEAGVDLRGRGGATRGAAKTAPGKKAAAKKSSTTKTAATKSPATKAAAKKAPAKKTPAKKTARKR